MTAHGYHRFSDLAFVPLAECGPDCEKVFHRDAPDNAAAKVADAEVLDGRVLAEAEVDGQRITEVWMSLFGKNARPVH